MRAKDQLRERAETLPGTAEPGGLAAWLLGRLRRMPKTSPRLAVVERIALGPRQSLALVEAEGRRLLVATSNDGGPVFFPLDPVASQCRRGMRRISW